MKGSQLQSVTLQITILFVAALSVSQLLNLAHRYFTQSEVVPALEAIRIADRITVTTAVIESTPAGNRSRIIDKFRGSNLLLALSPEPWIDGDQARDAKGRLLRDLLAISIPGATTRDIRVGYASAVAATHSQQSLSRNWDRLKSYPAPLGNVVDEFVTDPTFLVSVPLSDGSWLNLTAAYADTLDFWPLDQIAVLGVMVILVAALSVWAIRRLTAPIELFARAAARLGTDVNAPPIPVTGPAEVQGAIHAFNQMQERLQRFIDDRMQMVAAMSHDLRTPITRLRLRTEYLDDATQRAKALCDLDEMEHMINEVLGFARDEAQVGTSVNLDLSSMLQTICDDMADKGHRLEYVARAHPKVWCRANAIRRCLTNVIDNAVKYGRAARIALSTEGQDVVVHVDDRGPGIPAELREQVFRPFFRADASRNRDSGGTGLGLSVARNIARAHGGDVELADRRRGGLRVIVRLPGRIAPPDLPADAPATGDSADQPGGGRLPDPKIS